MAFFRPLLATFTTAVLSLCCTAPSAQAQDGYGQAPSGYQHPYGQGQPAPAPNYAAPNGYYPNGQGQLPANAALPRNLAPGQAQAPSMPQSMTVADWFKSYDQVRYRAQMNPSERQRADALLSKGLSILMPGDEKLAAKTLLNSLVMRYQRAANDLKSIPMIPPTKQLHQGYYQYFVTASNLFADYVRVQDNLFMTDASTGQPLAAGLIQRKQMLETLERNVKALDAQIRQQNGIAPYPY